MRYNGLYRPFEHWYHGGNIYFYSDPHFDDRDMEVFRSSCPSSEEQVAIINKVAHKNDTLVILGDIGNKEWLKKIKAYKVLVLGNHDAGPTTFSGYADEVYGGILMIGEHLVLSHEPLDFPYAVNIHGHIHDIRRFKNKYGHILVSAENINYTPISLTEIVKSGKLKEYVDIHRETIDKASTSVVEYI